MSFLDKAKDFLDKYDEQVDHALDKRTDHKYTSQIDRGVDEARKRAGAGDTQP